MEHPCLFHIAFCIQQSSATTLHTGFRNLNRMLFGFLLRLAEFSFLSVTAQLLLFYISHRHLLSKPAGSSGCQSHKPQLVLVFLLNHQLFQSHYYDDDLCVCVEQGSEKNGAKWEGDLIDTYTQSIVLVCVIQPSYFFLHTSFFCRHTHFLNVQIIRPGNSTKKTTVLFKVDIFL